MKLEEQVVSLKLAKELKKNGYPQKGLWRWYFGKLEYKSWIKGTAHEYEKEVYVAPTVAELGEKLPQKIKKLRLLWMGKINNEYHINYAQHTNGGEPYDWLSPCNWSDVIEANARAKMWLYLKKEGLIR